MRVRGIPATDGATVRIIHIDTNVTHGNVGSRDRRRQEVTLCRVTGVGDGVGLHLVRRTRSNVHVVTVLVGYRQVDAVVDNEVDSQRRGTTVITGHVIVDCRGVTDSDAGCGADRQRGLRASDEKCQGQYQADGFAHV